MIKMIDEVQGNQCADLIEYLAEHPEGITKGEAMDLLGIANLPGRIFDLRKAGFEIVTAKATKLNRRKKRIYFAIYRLAEHAEGRAEE